MKAITDLICENMDICTFRESIINLNGDFNFDKNDMIELGNVYFEYYPETVSNRNLNHIQLGYQIVRACVVEKSVKDLDENVKDDFRKIFFDIPSIEKKIEHLINMRGYKAVKSDYELISKRVNEQRELIDKLPIGKIKERFVGGISSIVAIVYLIKVNIEKFNPIPPSEGM